VAGAAVPVQRTKPCSLHCVEASPTTKLFERTDPADFGQIESR